MKLKKRVALSRKGNRKYSTFLALSNLADNRKNYTEFNAHIYAKCNQVLAESVRTFLLSKEGVKLNVVYNQEQIDALHKMWDDYMAKIYASRPYGAEISKKFMDSKMDIEEEDGRLVVNGEEIGKAFGIYKNGGGEYIQASINPIVYQPLNQRKTQLPPNRPVGNYDHRKPTGPINGGPNWNGEIMPGVKPITDDEYRLNYPLSTKAPNHNSRFFRIPEPYFYADIENDDVKRDYITGDEFDRMWTYIELDIEYNIDKTGTWADGEPHAKNRRRHTDALTSEKTADFFANSAWWLHFKGPQSGRIEVIWPPDLLWKQLVEYSSNPMYYDWEPKNVTDGMQKNKLIEEAKREYESKTRDIDNGTMDEEIDEFGYRLPHLDEPVGGEWGTRLKHLDSPVQDQGDFLKTLDLASATPQQLEHVVNGQVNINNQMRYNVELKNEIASQATNAYKMVVDGAESQANSHNLERKIQQLEHRILELETERKIQEQLIEELKREVQFKQDLLNSSQEYIDKYLTNNRENPDLNDAIKKYKDDIDNIWTQYRRDISALTKEARDLEDELYKVRGEKQTLETEYNDLTHMVKLKNERIDTLQAELIDIQTAHMNAENELYQLRSDLQNMIATADSERNQKEFIESEYESLKKRAVDLETKIQIQDPNQYTDILNQKEQEINVKQKEIMDLHQQIAIDNQKLSQLESKADELVTLLSNKNSSISRLGLYVGYLLDETLDINSIPDQDERALMQKMKEQYDRSISSRSTNQNQISSELNRIKMEKEKAISEVERLNEIVKKHEDTIKLKESEIEIKNQRIRDYETEINRLTQEGRRKDFEIKNKDDQILRLEKEIEALKWEKERYKESMQQMLGGFNISPGPPPPPPGGMGAIISSGVSSLVDNAAQKFISLKKEVEAVEEKIRKKDDEIAEARRIKLSLEQEISTLKHQLKSNQTQLQSEMGALQSEIITSLNSLERILGQLNQSANIKTHTTRDFNLQDVKSKTTNILQQISQLTGQAINNNREKNMTINFIKQEVEKLKERLKLLTTAEMKLKQLEQDISITQQQNQNLTSTINNLRREKEQQASEIERYKNELVRREQALKELNDKVARSEQAINNLQQTYQQQIKIINDNNTALAELNRKKTVSDEQAQFLEQEKKALLLKMEENDKKHSDQIKAIMDDAERKVRDTEEVAKKKIESTMNTVKLSLSAVEKTKEAFQRRVNFISAIQSQNVKRFEILSKEQNDRILQITREITKTRYDLFISEFKATTLYFKLHMMKQYTLLHRAVKDEAALNHIFNTFFCNVDGQLVNEFASKAEEYLGTVKAVQLLSSLDPLQGILFLKRILSSVDKLFPWRINGNGGIIDNCSRWIFDTMKTCMDDEEIEFDIISSTPQTPGLWGNGMEEWFMEIGYPKKRCIKNDDIYNNLCRRVFAKSEKEEVPPFNKKQRQTIISAARKLRRTGRKDTINSTKEMLAPVIGDSDIVDQAMTLAIHSVRVKNERENDNEGEVVDVYSNIKEEEMAVSNVGDDEKIKEIRDVAIIVNDEEKQACDATLESAAAVIYTNAIELATPNQNIEEMKKRYMLKRTGDKNKKKEQEYQQIVQKRKEIDQKITDELKNVKTKEVVIEVVSGKEIKAAVAIPEIKMFSPANVNIRVDQVESFISLGKAARSLILEWWDNLKIAFDMQGSRDMSFEKVLGSLASGDLKSKAIWAVYGKENPPQEITQLVRLVSIYSALMINKTDNINWDSPKTEDEKQAAVKKASMYIAFEKVLKIYVPSIITYISDNHKYEQALLSEQSFLKSEDNLFEGKEIEVN